MADIQRGRGPRPTSSRAPEEPHAERRARPLEARVLEALPNTMFAVELTDGQKVLCRISGDLKTRGMRVVPGDRVTVELSPYDLTRGKITSRLT